MIHLLLLQNIGINNSYQSVIIYYDLILVYHLAILRKTSNRESFYRFKNNMQYRAFSCIVHQQY